MLKGTDGAMKATR